MNDSTERERSPELLPLLRMAARLGVSSKWLRAKAEAGEIPGLQAGKRWLFRPDAVIPVVASMAAPAKSKGAEA